MSLLIFLGPKHLFDGIKVILQYTYTRHRSRRWSEEQFHHWRNQLYIYRVPKAILLFHMVLTYVDLPENFDSALPVDHNHILNLEIPLKIKISKNVAKWRIGFWQNMMPLI